MHCPISLLFENILLMAGGYTVMTDYNINYLKREKNPRSGIIKSDGMNFFIDVDPRC